METLQRLFVLCLLLGVCVPGCLVASGNVASDSIARAGSSPQASGEDYDEHALVSIVAVHPTVQSASGGIPAEYIVLRNLQRRGVRLDGWVLLSGKRRFSLKGVYISPRGEVALTTEKGGPFFQRGEYFVLTRGSLVADSKWIVALLSPSGRVISMVDSEDLHWEMPAHSGYTAVARAPEWRFHPAARWVIAGHPDSVHIPVDRAPRLELAYIRDKQTLMLHFNAPLDSLRARRPATYRVNTAPLPIRSIELTNWCRDVEIRLRHPFFSPGAKYIVRVDCYTSDRQWLPNTGHEAFLLDTLSASGLCVNEVMLNPMGSAPQYIELYNGGTKALDLSRVSVAVDGREAFPVATSPRILPPRQFAVLTKNARSLLYAYPSCDYRKVIATNKLRKLSPSGVQIDLTDAKGRKVDAVYLSLEDLFYMLKDYPGVSLERLGADKQGQASKGWGSALLSMGGASPGASNSASRTDSAQLDKQLQIRTRYVGAGAGAPPVAVEFAIQIEQPALVTMGVATLRGDTLWQRIELLSRGGVARFEWDGTDASGQPTRARELVVFASIKGASLAKTSCVFLNPFLL